MAAVPSAAAASAPPAPDRCRASEETVGYWKSSISEISRPRASLRRACTLAMRSEWPPRSKKLSSTPTASTFSSSCQAAVMVRSSSLCGAL